MTKFYEEARNLWTATQEEQIEKGILKYREPFNPFSWSPEQLLKHAIQENVDQLHYMVGLYQLIVALRESNERLKKEKTVLLEMLHSKALEGLHDDSV